MPPTPPPERQDPLLGCVTRLTWMALLPAALFFSAFLIAEGRSLAGISPHLTLVGAAALALVTRWVDVAVMGGQTADGRPATTADLRRYAVTLAVVSAALWLVAMAVARLGLLR